jgi:anaerobic ribonucleoside-triphosphate reductase activating protein
MNYHNITKQDMLNGDGIRVVLWVAGCTHHCHNCQNPITWDENGGLPFDESAEKELFEALDKPYIDGITFSGGDPLHPNNRSEIFRLIKKCRTLLPDKSIWLYTGFLWDEIKDISGIENVDTIVDGKFIEELKDNNLHWVGSSNQRIINVKEALKS